jgi:hypothetical protein
MDENSYFSEKDDHAGNGPTGMVAFQAQECPCDKPDFQFVFCHRYRLLAGLWNSEWADVCNIWNGIALLLGCGMLYAEMKWDQQELNL